MKNVGLHFRFKDTITEIIDQALELNVPIFQCFLTDFMYRKHIELNYKTIEKFRRLSGKFKRFYAHGSYIINLADDRDHYILKRELELSKKLGFKYLILHPGAFKPNGGSKTLAIGIDTIVRNINRIMKNELEVILILENTAFAGNVIGGDLSHFESILIRLDFPDRIRFCVDTAHAYVYGYDLNDVIARESFMTILRSSIIKNFIQVIHLNNSDKLLGSRMDSHSILSEGQIGLNNLRSLVKDPLFNNRDIILEMPEISIEHKAIILDMIAEWL